MTAMAQAFSTALLDFLWQGMVVAFLLWVALYLLRKRRAQARYAVSCVALAILMALPVATAWLEYRAPAAAAGRVAATAAAPPSAAIVTPESAAASHWVARAEPWALPLWSAGVLFFSLRLGWGCWRVSAMRRRGRPADADVLATVATLAARMGLLRPVRVLAAALPDGPSVAGWLRPVLLLPPATVLGLTPQQLEAVLAHELAHIRRYDHLVNAVQTLVETLLFYHPAVWWTSARIREERELCCDDLAVRACGDALCFARALTKLERLRVMAPAAALGSTGGPLMYRVQRLIGAGRQECAPSKLSGILAFSLALACLALNVHWARGQERPEQTSTYTIAIDLNRAGDAPGVTVDLGGAALLHRTYVGYPEAARVAGIQGTVAVQVSMDAGGNLSDAHVVSGPMELRRAVMSSIFEWHFAQDSAGSTRVVNVNFQAPTGTAATEPRGVPGILVEGQPVTATVDAAPATVSFVPDQPEVTSDGRVTVTTDAGANRVLIWNRIAEGGSGDGVKADQPFSSRVKATKARTPLVRELQSQLEEQRAALASADGENPELRQNVRDLEARLAQAEGETGRRPVEGRTVKAIDVIGLPEAATKDLGSRLPLHVGDTITGGSLEAVGAVVRKFDEHLEWRVVLLEDDGASIRINAPGAERGLSIRK